MATITDFFVGETKNFTINITLNDVVQNIAADTVTLTIKADKSVADSEALLQENADCATDGANGNAIFSLTPVMTAVDPGKHFIDVVWYPSAGGEYVIYDSTIKAKERVSDL